MTDIDKTRKVCIEKIHSLSKVLKTCNDETIKSTCYDASILIAELQEKLEEQDQVIMELTEVNDALAEDY